MLRYAVPLGMILAATAVVRGADPAANTARGDRMLEAYFRAETRKMADACLADIPSKADWEKKRPELRRQFLEMMGLWPLPPRTDLKATVTGKVETEHYTVEKLHFQSSPGLYVTANLYLPKKAKVPAPAILYVCGHANVKVDGISYGSKVHYQYHPAWFAEHGYVALVLDTLQLGEIPGIHHGTHHLGMWWWHTLGYTPAGIECWNAMRALDYLESRKEVDRKRIGVTGRSGGGATSWWIAAADDRPACIVPVAGIADMRAHICEGLIPRFRKGIIPGHCDCMYFTNTYRWDFPLVAALCAPRPLMLGNSDADDIFPLPSYRRLAEKVRKVYDLYGASEKFVLLETRGPHKDTPELRKGINEWMNRWLKDDRTEATEPDRPRLAPKQLQVLDRAPDDAGNATIHEFFLKPARAELPESAAVTKEWWPGKSKEWRQALREKVFRGWPESAPPLNVRAAAEVRLDGLRLRAFDFTSEENVELRLWLLTHEKTQKLSLFVLNLVDEEEWQEMARRLGPAFQESLMLATEPKRSEVSFDAEYLEESKTGIALIAPRGIGPTRWAEVGTPADNHIKRRFVLLGRTLDSQRVWDVRRALAVLRQLPETKGVPLRLEAKRNMAGIALYAALFEPKVKQLELAFPPASHRQGPIFLNVRRILDMPQAMALAFPRPIRLYVKDDAEAKTWSWPLQLQKQLGQEYLKIRTVKD